MATADSPTRSVGGATDPADGARSAIHWSKNAAAYLVLIAIILSPALWNGFPLVYADTGGYLIRPFVHTLELGRSALYGEFLSIGIFADFWPNVAIQALLCAWIVRLILRTEGLPSLRSSIITVITLTIVTSLPWYAGQLEPDIFLPLSVLAFYLIAFAASKLRKWEIAALLAVVGFAIASHMSIYATLLLLFASFSVVWIAARRAERLPQPGLILPALSLILGTGLALASNYAIAGAPTFTPGGSTFLFARLLQDGYVKTYLDRNCPDASLSICDYRDKLPDNTDDWLWDNDDAAVLKKLGGWRAFEPEARRIVHAIIWQQPIALMGSLLKETLQQMCSVATGEGMNGGDNWHTKWVIQTYAPETYQDFDASAQQHDAYDFHLINMIHVTLALCATFSLPVLVFLCWRRRPATATLLGTLFAALVTNAAICATFSNVNVRYQSRIVWIGVLGAGIGCRQLLKSRRTHSPSAAYPPSEVTHEHR